MEASDWLSQASVSDWIALAALLVAVMTFIVNRRAIHREQSDRAEQIALVSRQVSREGAAQLIMENFGVEPTAPSRRCSCSTFATSAA